jgi:hypothetical protein
LKIQVISLFFNTLVMIFHGSGGSLRSQQEVAMSVAFLFTLARALLVHVCAELVRFVLTTAAPDLPALVCIAIGLVLGVAVVEIAVMLLGRATGPRSGE